MEVDLAVVGGGFTGLWTALRAVERAPGTRVVVLEADRIAEHATGRNGGFCALVHARAAGRECGTSEARTCTHRQRRLGVLLLSARSALPRKRAASAKQRAQPTGRPASGQ
jgi:glycine/D-amino acid oxidase-like deaminating enzyme